jgi:hypothetical protein
VQSKKLIKFLTLTSQPAGTECHKALQPVLGVKPTSIQWKILKIAPIQIRIGQSVLQKMKMAPILEDIKSLVIF